MNVPVTIDTMRKNFDFCHSDVARPKSGRSASTSSLAVSLFAIASKAEESIVPAVTTSNSNDGNNTQARFIHFQDDVAVIN